VLCDAAAGSATVDTCEAWSGTSAPTLIGVVPTGQLTYVPANSSFTAIEAKVSSAALVFAGLSNDACRNAYGRFVASQAFMPCDSSLYSQFGAAIPQFPCSTLCTDVLTICSSNPSDITLISVLNGGAINCTSYGTRKAGLADWPAPGQTITFAPGIQTTCAAWTAAVNPRYGRCAPYNGTVCANVTTAPLVYLPAGFCQQQIEDQLVTLPSALNLLSTNCRAATAAHFCNSAYNLYGTTTTTGARLRCAVVALVPDRSPVSIACACVYVCLFVFAVAIWTARVRLCRTPYRAHLLRL
jgi:hypothetical protein